MTGRGTQNNIQQTWAGTPWPLGGNGSVSPDRRYRLQFYFLNSSSEPSLRTGTHKGNYDCTPTSWFMCARHCTNVPVNYPPTWRMTWFFLGSRSKSTVPVSTTGVGRLSKRCSVIKKGAVLAAPRVILLSLDYCDFLGVVWCTAGAVESGFPLLSSSMPSVMFIMNGLGV